MKNKKIIDKELNDLMNSELEKCGECSKIRECWALKNLSLGMEPGHIEHRRPVFEFGFICRREAN